MPGSGSEDYRKYLDTRFDNLDRSLKRIYAQALRTNSRVTHLECDMEEAQKGVSELEKKDLTHVIDCPVALKLEETNNRLLEYNFLLKYPKTVIIILAFVMLSFFAVAYEFAEKLTTKTKASIEVMKTENQVMQSENEVMQSENQVMKTENKAVKTTIDSMNYGN